MRERVALDASQGQGATPLISATPSNQFAPAARGALSDVQKGNTARANASAASNLIETVGVDIARAHKRYNDEQALLGRASAKANEQAVTDMLYGLWAQNESPDTTEPYDKRLKRFNQLDSVSTALSQLDGDPVLKKKVQDNFVAKTFRHDAESRSAKAKAAWQAHGESMFTANVLAAGRNPKRGNEIIKGALTAYQQSGGDSEVLLGKAMHGLQESLKTGKMSDIMQVNAAIKQLEPFCNAGGRAMDGFVALKNAAAVATKTADDKAYRAEHMQFNAEADKIRDGGDPAEMEHWLKNNQAVERGFLTEKEARAYIAATSKAHTKAMQQLDYSTAFHEGKDLSAEYSLKPDAVKRLDASVSESMEQQPDGTYKFQTPAEQLQVLNGLASNPDLKMPQVTSRLYGGLSFGAMAMDSDGKGNAQLTNSLNNARQTAAALGEGSAKRIMGDANWQTYKTMDTFCNGDYSKENLAKYQMYVRNTETVEKRTLDSGQSLKMQQAVASSLGMSQKDTARFMAENADEIATIQRGCNYNPAAVAAMVHNTIYAQYGEIGGQRLKGGAHVLDTAKRLSPNEDPADTVQAAIEHYGKAKGADGLHLVAIDKGDNGKGILVDKYGVPYPVDLDKMLRVTADSDPDAPAQTPKPPEHRKAAAVSSDWEAAVEGGAKEHATKQTDTDNFIAGMTAASRAAAAQ